MATFSPINTGTSRASFADKVNIGFLTPEEKLAKNKAKWSTAQSAFDKLVGSNYAQSAKSAWNTAMQMQNDAAGGYATAARNQAAAAGGQTAAGFQPTAPGIYLNGTKVSQAQYDQAMSRPPVWKTTTNPDGSITKRQTYSYNATPQQLASGGRLVGTPGAIAQYLGKPNAGQLLAQEQASTLAGMKAFEEKSRRENAALMARNK